MQDGPEDLGERVREKLLAACKALSAEQRDYLINFMWLCSHAPRPAVKRVHAKLLRALEGEVQSADQVTNALQQAIAELREAMKRMNPD